jgi:excisionase family DNA binding protein
MSDYLTVSEAAARLKVSERTIRRRCENGKLTALLKPTATGNAWHIEADSCGQSADTAANGADTVSNENQTQTGADTAAESSDRFGQAAAIGADTDRALGRLEGMALSGLEKSIAQAVENAVALAITPLADEIRALRLQVEKLEKQSREDAPQAPIIPPGDQTPAAQKQSAPRGTKRPKLTAWQRAIMRMIGAR